MMSKQTYRKAMTAIAPSESLVRKTAVRMQNAQTERIKPMRLMRYRLSVSVLLGISIFVAFIIREQLIRDDTSLPTAPPQVIVQPNIEDGNKKSVLDSSIVMAQIMSHFVPFQADEYAPVRAPYPHFPLEYDALKQDSSAIVKVTIQAADVYRDKMEVYHPRASFGTYIYIAQVESVLYGEGIMENTLIPITERAWAMLDNQAEKPNWSFKPYTARPLMALKEGEQYVLFLAEKDDKEMHPVVDNGFGVFSLQEMKRESGSYTVDQLRKMHQENMEKTSSPMHNNLVYRLFALEAYHEFNGVLRE